MDQEFWAGIAVEQKSEKAVNVGIAIHDGTYSVDFAIYRIFQEDKDQADSNFDWVADQVTLELSAYRKEHLCKILGAGVTPELHELSPNLCSRLWSELDIVPFVVESNRIVPINKDRPGTPSVDEAADSAARKCLA